MASTPCHLRERRNNNSQTQKAASSRAKGKQEQARQRAEPNWKTVIQRKRRTNHPAQQDNDMKFNVNSDEMGKSIQGLAKMVSGKSSLAILDHFLFVVDDNKLHVTASDGENMMRTTMDIDVLSMPDKEDDRKFCIHNTVICDFLKNIPSQPITFDVDMENSETKISYMNGHIQFPCTSGNEYPSICFMKDEYESVSLPSDTILEDITRTSPFTGQDTLRPVMNAICFNFLSEGLDVVSSNGGVLVKITHTSIRTEKEAKFLLPPKPVTMLKYFLSKEEKDVSIRFTDNAAVFECDNWQLTCRLVEGRYPNYNSVIPQNSNIEVTVDKKQLQESIRRMLPMGNQSMKTVKFETAGTVLTVSSEDVDFNKSAKEDVTCETSGNGITIGVNGEVINTMLSQIHSDVAKLRMTEYSRPIIIVPDADKENETFMGLVMPTLIS